MNLQKRLAGNSPGSLILLAVITIFTACKKEKNERKEETIVISASGNINSKLDEFRQLLGSPLNTSPNATGGRREIDWEGVPKEFTGKPLPPDFFNPVGPNAVAARQRGLVYEGGSEFMVSDDNFGSINSDLATQVRAFSGTRGFANISSSLWEVFPQKPGTNMAGRIQGFGIVFSDVDRPQSTFMEFFDEGTSLGRFYAPVSDASSGFSFLGVYFKEKRITRIRVGHEGIIKSGEKDISHGGLNDLVILDDFLYDEPVAK